VHVYGVEDVQNVPKTGVLIHGLMLQGCVWNNEECKLIEYKRNESFVPMSVIWRADDSKNSQFLRFGTKICRKDFRSRAKTSNTTLRESFAQLFFIWKPALPRFRFLHWVNLE